MKQEPRRTELLITRRPGQSFLIRTLSGLIRITRLERDRLSIQAPEDVSIIREELEPDQGDVEGLSSDGDKDQPDDLTEQEHASVPR